MRGRAGEDECLGASDGSSLQIFVEILCTGAKSNPRQSHTSRALLTKPGLGKNFDHRGRSLRMRSYTGVPG